MAGQSMSYSNGAQEESTHQARPKLLRRPAQFSTPATTAQKPANLAPTAELPAPLNLTPLLELVAPQPPKRSWQDDGRFGMLMVIIVVFTNLVLMLWLPQLSKTDKLANTTITSTAGTGGIMPAATIAPAPQITTYARPSDGLPTARVINAHQLTPMDDNFLTVPTTRHVLDESTEDSDQ